MRRPNRASIDADQLRTLYVDRRLTVNEIAALVSPPAPLVTVPRWSPQVAYAVGIITTDGNLSG
jgi:hypothetical protein